MTTNTNRIDYNLMYERIDQWVAALAAAHAERYPALASDFDMTPKPQATYFTQQLNKYIRIVMGDGNGNSRSVHAFVNRETGDVYKAAGWKAPAKGIRYNLLNDESFARMMNKLDPFGSYLYVR